MEKISIGDRVLVKNAWGSMYHALVLSSGWGVLGKRYLIKSRYRDLDYGTSGERIDYKWWFQIACKN